jgi:DNA-binding transcriptional MerR regulator
VANRVELPDKLFFKIGEVARLTGVKPHVLRYWESEFSSIRPQKSKTNQRLYRRRDVEAVLAIRHLLYDRGFTIDGARKHIRAEGVEESLPPPDPEKVAASARKEALAELDKAVVKARAEEGRRRRVEIVELRRLVREFLGRFGADPEE